MKEALVYLFIAVSSLIVMGYAVHMFVGGLIAEEAERWLITVICVIAAGIMGYLARDLVTRRHSEKK